MIDTSQFNLEGKSALITGGSRGIGEATAIAFAKAGADVAVTSRKLPELERVAGEVTKLGRKAMALACHVGRVDQLQPVVDKVVAEFGKIDILINNAGTSFYMPAIELNEKGWDSVLNTNLKGLFFLSQFVGRVMKENGGGKIINVASTAGVRAQVPTIHYSISKAGVIMTTAALAKEWAPFNIRVNCIAPGAIDTAIYDAMFAPLPEDQRDQAKKNAAGNIPMKRAGDPREIADTMLFLASDASSYITGQTLLVDGGVLL